MASPLPTGRELINLVRILRSLPYSDESLNSGLCLTIEDPIDENRAALYYGLRKILPFMYRLEADVINDLKRYGLDFPEKVRYFPTSPAYQKAHLGEILACTYFEECESSLVLTYKWRLNTAQNQNALGIDVLAFDLNSDPVRIYALGIKTSYGGGNGKAPSGFYSSVNELVEYIKIGKLDNDLVVTAANLQVSDEVKKAFEDWYNPYSQALPSSRPVLVPVAFVVMDANHYKDEFADHPLTVDFGLPGLVRVLLIGDLEEFILSVYS